MNILVTGADGQLGRALRRATDASRDRYLFTDAAELDVTDREAVRRAVTEGRIDAIVNCAAYTDVDRAERDEAAAERLNAAAAGYLAAAAAERGVVLIHLSTDYVFGGAAEHTPRTECDPVAPLGVYGRTKRRGEEAVLASGCRHLILRTAWLYGECGRNFVRTMLARMAAGADLKVVFDQVGTPTYAGDLAAAIHRIVEERLFEGRDGIYHYTDEGVCSWYDFARRIAELGGYDPRCVRPCRTAEYPAAAPRPAYSVLDKSKFRRTFGAEIPYWSDSLRTCIENLRKELP